MVPKTVVAGGPNDPVIASLNLVGCKFDAAIHVLEVVFICGRKGRCRPFRTQRLVFDRTRFVAAAKHRADSKPDAHPHEPVSCHCHSPLLALEVSLYSLSNAYTSSLCADDKKFFLDFPLIMGEQFRRSRLQPWIRRRPS